MDNPYEPPKTLSDSSNRLRIKDQLIVDAPPTMFDDLELIIENSSFRWTKESSDSLIRGIRRKDTATYEITRDGIRVELYMERRLGNPSMHIGVIPYSQPEDSSAELARQIIEFLIANGAYEKEN